MNDTGTTDAAARPAGTLAAGPAPAAEGSPATDSPASGGHALTVVHLFVVHGVVALGMGLVPALVTTFREEYGLSGGQIANVQNLKDVGLIAAMFAGPVVLRRAGIARTTMLALLVGLAGCAVLIGVRSYPGVLTGAFLHGAAFSLGSLATVSHLYRLPARHHRISALYATFSVGNFVAPFLVGVLVPGDGDYRAVYGVFTAALVVSAVAGALLNRSRAGGGPGRADRAGTGGAREPGRAPEARLTAALVRTWLPHLVVYATLMAAETVVVSWVTTLGRYRYGLSLSDASFLLALLWITYTPARLFGDALVRRTSVTTVLLSGVLLTVVGDVLLCAGPAGVARVGVVVFALGAAPLIPVYQGWLLGRTPVERHGPLNASLGVGAAALTTAMVWLTGIGVDVDTRVPFAVSAVCSAGLALWVLRDHRTKTS
ncbi:MFS transporter [Streptomyces ziwulingensis]|uniref:MFS transporter n=1 Tax=Streptomyces ziwulingensis TaxID=1045501 RepID=A0ABP9ATT6_9ACTN